MGAKDQNKNENVEIEKKDLNEIVHDTPHPGQIEIELNPGNSNENQK
ncbi:hypothetical protein QA612_07075 [Evansella sp. AB-P1]|nr:hypothetical protein [Evansella sp. AB-P1]MDG5787251.1 hypothetical protein [Evansella sp. AB-P1]